MTRPVPIRSIDVNESYFRCIDNIRPVIHILREKGQNDPNIQESSKRYCFVMSQGTTGKPNTAGPHDRHRSKNRHFELEKNAWKSNQPIATDFET